VLVVLGMAQLMIMLDATVVNIALPEAQQDLGFSESRKRVAAGQAAFFGIDQRWPLTAETLRDRCASKRGHGGRRRAAWRRFGHAIGLLWTPVASHSSSAVTNLLLCRILPEARSTGVQVSVPTWRADSARHAATTASVGLSAMVRTDTWPAW